MKVVVDTNIVFSAILNSSSGIGKLLLTSDKNFDFYTCDHLRTELHRHREKLKKLTKLSDDELDIIIELILRNISTFNEALLPKIVLHKAYEQAADIDESDTPFLALALHLRCKLWTGDKKLIIGLRKKGVNNLLSTQELLEIRNNKG